MSFSFRALSFLLVGNNLHMLRLLQTILACNGAQSIRLARDGREALAVMRAGGPPDVVIAEWIMAPMDGLELARYIRRSEKSPAPHLPIILMTGAADDNLLSLAIASGASRIIWKPIHAKALVDSIRSLALPGRAPVRGSGQPLRHGERPLAGEVSPDNPRALAAPPRRLSAKKRMS